MSDLGNEVIEELERDAAGLLLDLGRAMAKRFRPGLDFAPEVRLSILNQSDATAMRLPRRSAYNRVIATPRVQTRPDDIA